MKYIVYLIDRILLTRQRLLKKIFYFCLVLIFFVLNYKHIFRRCYNNHDFEMKLCIVNHYVSIPLASEPGEGDKGSLSAPPPLRFCKVKHNLNYFLLAKVFDGPSTPPPPYFQFAFDATEFYLQFLFRLLINSSLHCRELCIWNAKRFNIS